MRTPRSEHRSTVGFPIIIILGAIVGIASYLAIAGSLQPPPIGVTVYFPANAEIAEAGE